MGTTSQGSTEARLEAVGKGGGYTVFGTADLLHLYAELIIRPCLLLAWRQNYS